LTEGGKVSDGAVAWDNSRADYEIVDRLFYLSNETLDSFVSAG
jgi:hypothetical protein